MSVLVTGGAGYIGSHAAVELLGGGHDIIMLDNFINGKPAAIDSVKKISGKDFRFYETDVRDRSGLQKVFSENKIDSVMHFAGLKAVGESVLKPLEYYDNNVGGTIALCEVMAEFGCKKIVFSSSATVYGIPERVPVTERDRVSAINPYGRTKLMIEKILGDLYISDNGWSVALLRYFNPIGAHKSGKIGEDPNGIPNNLMPYICRVAAGKLPKLYIYGDDYPTRDGTGIRDYIHVTDLAKGHLKALEKCGLATGVKVWNLGTGTGYTVLEVVNAFMRANEVSVPYEITGRRPGDAAECYADVRKSKEELDWSAVCGLEEMCADSWRFAAGG